MLQLALIPLDERPVNTRYPALLADSFGIVLHLPPPALLSRFRQPADCAGLIHWLDQLAPTLDGVIVSVEMLGYGSLIASRISHEPATTILSRLEHLRTLKQRRPALPIYGFNLITRISNANWADEEPLYWADYGTRFYRFSQLLDLTGRAAPAATLVDELTQLRSELPAAHVQDFLRRRARNHTVNLQVLQWLADGVFDLLVLSSDDTNPVGLPTREKHWLADWGNYLGLGERLLMYPGADEVGCALLARMVNQLTDTIPTFTVDYALPGGEEVTAPFEDGPVRLTVERQIRAVGGKLLSASASSVDKASALRLFVNPPIGGEETDWPHPHTSDEQRRPHLAAFVERLVATSAMVALLADVAFANGADPVLMALAQGTVDFGRLAAFGAWNTAGNTIGVALAQACATRFASGATAEVAQQRFLLRHLLEDWGYMTVIRGQVGEWLVAQQGSSKITDELVAPVCAEIEQRLQRFLAEQLPAFAQHFRIKPGSLQLPWQRLFEIEFTLEATD
jgi:hypothetical protein